MARMNESTHSAVEPNQPMASIKKWDRKQR